MKFVDWFNDFEERRPWFFLKCIGALTALALILEKVCTPQWRIRKHQMDIQRSK
jgi:membrane protein YdbS with pleckstrin-like domain